ncbi:MAG: prolyl oligopeptidase family serine peptidase [Propionibacteriales bacterium]|nr:prolyl oligopeptidase family serine peptidase [Propionibacteriales bacterium]
MKRWIPVVLLGLLTTACSGTEEPGGVGPGRPTSSGPNSSVATPEGSASSAAPTPHRVSLLALRQKTFDGDGLTLGTEVLRTANHTQYDVTYRSGKLTISGRLAVPNGDGPFPAVVLAHGYIDPAVYAIGQGMTRERAWFGERGYVALHVDYRGHGGSDPDRSGGLDMRMGYTEDVINAVHALRAWDGPVDDERVGLVGRSMGGGVVQNALVVAPGLVDAGAVFASVSSIASENFNHFIRSDGSRDLVTRTILRRYGEPKDNIAFWDGISARSYFDDITEPVLILHGTADDTCPIRWSRQTARALRRAGVDVTLATYPGEQHAFGLQFDRAMTTTERFLRRAMS